MTYSWLQVEKSEKRIFGGYVITRRLYINIKLDLKKKKK